MILIFGGEVDEAIRFGETIKKHASTYFQSDIAYANFLGNLSELMYNRDRRPEANEAVKEGRLIVWYKLRDYGLDLEQTNINFKGDVKVNKARVKPSEDVLAQF